MMVLVASTLAMEVGAIPPTDQSGTRPCTQVPTLTWVDGGAHSHYTQIEMCSLHCLLSAEALKAEQTGLLYLNCWRI